MRRAIITPRDEERDMEAVAGAISGDDPDDPFNRVVFTESHDEVANGKARVPEEIAPGDCDNVYARKRAVLGAALVFTAPGIPMLFQGQEFLSCGWFDDRVPVAWQKEQDNQGILRLFRDLIRLRRNLDGTTGGLQGAHVNVFHVDDEAKLLAFHRWDEGGPGDDVIVVANFANRTHAGVSSGFPGDGVWRVRFNSDRLEYDASFGDHRCPDVVAAAAPAAVGAVDGLPYWGNVTIAPYAVLVLAQTGAE